MKKTLVFLILTLLVSVSVTSCSDDQEITWTEDDVDPEKILAAIPVYPDAEITTENESGLKPLSAPYSLNPYSKFDTIVYETGSVQYVADSAPGKILKWYRNELEAAGYRTYCAHIQYSGPDIDEVDGTRYYRPELPVISVEVHVSARDERTVFAILVHHDTTTSPDNVTPVPDDITSISVAYIVDKKGSTVKHVIVNENDIEKIVKIINSLPKRVYGPPSVSRYDIFTMVLQSDSRGIITCTLDSDGHVSVSRLEHLLLDSNNTLLKKVKASIDID